MEYPILFTAIILVLIVTLLMIIRTLTKFLSNKKRGAFHVKLKLGHLEFALDADSEKV